MTAGAGYLAAGVAVLAFGSNFVPVKKYHAGDGMFFQWIMCCSIWMVGLIVQFIRDSPQFEPLAMLGGVLWTIGNSLCVPIIHFIGMGLGLLIWGGANLLMGWMSGHFGLFGIKKGEVNSEALNIAGFLICLSSLGVFFFVKPELTKAPDGGFGTPSTYEPIDSSTPNTPTPYTPLFNKKEESDFGMLDKLTAPQKRVIGCVGAVVAGLFFGLNFNPPQYLMDNPDQDGPLCHAPHSKHALDYVFSHFSGIFVCSTLIFLGYCAAKKNQPKIYPEIILPGFFSGCLWAIAQTCWFIANEELSLVISFPIITTGPGIIASLWSIFLFKEIRGRRNFVFFILALIITLIGVTLISLSKS